MEGLMTNRPLVSIVMPVFNGAQFLAEAVDSVRAQFYSNWELFICDDGSTDGTEELARAYAEQEPRRIRVLAHPGHENLGVSATRNLALRHALGELIALLDADDVWLPHKLEEQTALLAHSSAGVLAGASRYWYGWTGDPGDAEHDWTPSTGFPSPSLLEPPELLTAILEHRAAVPCPCSIVARHEIVRRVGGFEDEFRRLYEDQVFYAKLFVNTPVLVVDTCWDLYRQHPRSICATDVDTSEERLRYLLWLRAYLRQQKVAEPALWTALRREIWRLQYPRAMRLSSRIGGAVSRTRRRVRRVLSKDPDSMR